VVRPPANEKRCVSCGEEAGLSERTRLWVLKSGCTVGAGGNPAKGTDEVALRARLRELAAERPRIRLNRGCTFFLRREKDEDGTFRWRSTHKKVSRLTGRRAGDAA